MDIQKLFAYQQYGYAFFEKKILLFVTGSSFVVLIGEGFAPAAPWRRDTHAGADELKAALPIPKSAISASTGRSPRPTSSSSTAPRDHQRDPPPHRRGPARGLIAMAPLLDVDSISVSFGGLLTLGGASIQVEAGRVTGLIGPNGSGQDHAVQRHHRSPATHVGRVRLDGADVTRAGHSRARLSASRAPSNGSSRSAASPRARTCSSR